MVRAIENEAILGKAVDIWGVEGGLGIVNLQIEGRLVVGDDEEKVGLLGESQRSESEEEDKSRHTLIGNEIPNLRRSQKESGHELGRVPIEMERVGLCVCLLISSVDEIPPLFSRSSCCAFWFATPWALWGERCRLRNPPARK